ncbi:Hypothetical predicted protein, partial [Mytilus galloprovincialis]
DGGLSNWENSTCFVICGDGTVTIKRTCNNPVPSDGGKNCSGKSINTDCCYPGDCTESCSTSKKESDNKSGQGSDNRVKKECKERKERKETKRKGKKQNRNGRY